MLTVLSLPIIPSPTTCCVPGVWFGFPPRLTAWHGLSAIHIPRGTLASWASPLSSRLATTTGRIEFVVILRTDRSPPVALHPASRRRSYVRLQCSNPTLTGTCTPPIQHHHKRTRCGILPLRERLGTSHSRAGLYACVPSAGPCDRHAIWVTIQQSGKMPLLPRRGFGGRFLLPRGRLRFRS